MRGHVPWQKTDWGILPLGCGNGGSAKATQVVTEPDPTQVSLSPPLQASSKEATADQPNGKSAFTTTTPRTPTLIGIEEMSGEALNPRQVLSFYGGLLPLLCWVLYHDVSLCPQMAP